MCKIDVLEKFDAIVLLLFCVYWLTFWTYLKQINLQIAHAPCTKIFVSKYTCQSEYNRSIHVESDMMLFHFIAILWSMIFITWWNHIIRNRARLIYAFFPGIGLYIKGNCSDYFTFYLTCNSKTIICASLADLVNLT